MPANRPELRQIAILAAELGTGAIVDSYGQEIMPTEAGSIIASFAGTGSFHAHSCWRQNKDIKRCIGSAVGQDHFSGLPLKYLNLRDVSDQDCAGSLDLETLKKSFLQRGMVMNLAQNLPSSHVSLREAAKNDPEMKKALDVIASGNAEIQAPCDAMFNEPSVADESRIDAMLAKIFGD